MSKRASVIEKVNSPIGFYVLALLIVESFIGTMIGVADFSSYIQFCCFLIGVVLFLLTIGIVTAIVWCKPHVLVYGERSHFGERMGTPPPEFGTNEKSVSEEEMEELDSVEQTAG